MEGTAVDSEEFGEGLTAVSSETSFERVYKNLYSVEIAKDKGISYGSPENSLLKEHSIEGEFSKTPSSVSNPRNTKMANENSFSFRDIEESLESFDGETRKDVTVWVKEYEDIATMCHWNDIQKYLYARRLLRGAAKLAIEAEVNVRNWAALKETLLKEFARTKCSIDLHRALENRKKLPGESYLEYVYAMKRIASEGTIDEQSIVIHVIEGIPDDASNKALLYEAQTIADLKVKLRAYEVMKSQRASKVQVKSVSKPNPVKKLSSNKERCGTCGAYSHNSYDCPHKTKGTRCFNCSQFGHISAKCPHPRRAREQEQNQGHVNSISVCHSNIVVNINNRDYIALVDTGSDVTLIKKSIYATLRDNVRTKGPSIVLTGFGRNIKKTVCSVSLDMNINGENFNVRSHVVPDEWLVQDVLIGKDVLRDATLILKDGKVTIYKKVSVDDRDDSLNFLQEIDVMALTHEDITASCCEVLDEDLRAEIRNLISEYKPISPPKSCVEMNITLDEESPIYQKPRRLAPKEKQIVRDQIHKWLDDGIIQYSNSDFASPVVLAKKKDGSYRLCIDYRKLNRKIIKDRYPLPVMEEVLENLYNAKVFTTLDLRNGFFHVDVDEASRKYTSFVTSDGQYEFLKAPFGLCNSPAVFQRFINSVFQDLIRKGFLLIYMDDIVIPSVDNAENLEKLKQVLDVAKRNGLVIKWSKCKFLQRKVEFLGHVIEEGSVKPSQDKTKAVMNFPVPKSVKDIQSFLGLTGFFRKFVANYATIAKPLTDLTRKNTIFSFGEKQIFAFNQLKECLCREPVLKLFNPDLETELHADASKLGLGAVLLQKHNEDMKFHPVFFFEFQDYKM